MTSTPTLNDAQVGANQNRKSVQEVSKQRKAQKTYSKTDQRYWMQRIFKNSWSQKTERRETIEWCLKVAYKGRRETVNLRTPNKEAAASRAADLYRTLTTQGWSAAMAPYKGREEKPAPQPVFSTVGDLLRVISGVVPFRASTFGNYAHALRRITADIGGIEANKSKFDGRHGGRSAWLSVVDALPLTLLTPTAIQQWRVKFEGVATNPLETRRAQVSAASYIRNARSLFTEKCLTTTQGLLVLPDPIPFSGIKLRRIRNPYQSRIDAPALLQAAVKDLKGDPSRRNQWLIFILGLLLGLRKREIDTLLWRSVDLKKKLLTIEATEHFQPKTEESAAVLDLAPQLVSLLRETQKKALTDFVLDVPGSVGRPNDRTYYRAAADFTALYEWLRSKGVTALKPLHELRKEAGALVADTAGIYAASLLLRHSDIKTTTETYAAKKSIITTGLEIGLTNATTEAQTPSKGDHS